MLGNQSVAETRQAEAPNHPSQSPVITSRLPAPASCPQRRPSVCHQDLPLPSLPWAPSLHIKEGPYISPDELAVIWNGWLLPHLALVNGVTVRTIIHNDPLR
ncbi:unnamed protein product [Natator depressus]